MKSFITFSSAVLRLIPIAQKEITIGHVIEFFEALDRLGTMLNKCPKIGGTDGMEEHPAIFHYFYASTDIYICEYDHNDQMFGYAVLNGDLKNSEWGYFSLSELTKIQQLNIEYYFEEQSVEAALYKSYPDYFKKPQSLMN